MKILLLGGNGQLGRRLRTVLPELGHLTAWQRNDLDLRDAEAIRCRVHALCPDLIVNAAAYTAVDRAEVEREHAYQVNAVAPGVLAEAAVHIGARLVHFSTDYVFDGQKQEAYQLSDPAHSRNVYGASKWEGEEHVRASGAKHLILRTSGVYGWEGPNFLQTMLRLARTRDELRVVDDQWCGPTWTGYIGETTLRMLQRWLSPQPPVEGGTFHVTATGHTTWCRFARTLLDHACEAGLIDAVPVVYPISSAEYGAEAERPAMSELSMKETAALWEIPVVTWEMALQRCFKEAPFAACHQ